MSLPSCACVCQRRSFHTWPRATLPSFPMPSTLLCRTCVDAGHCCIRCTCTSFHSRTLSEHSSHHPVKSPKKKVASPFPLPLKRIRRNTLYTLRFLLPGARPFPSETRTRDQMHATFFLATVSTFHWTPAFHSAPQYAFRACVPKEASHQRVRSNV